MNNSTSGKTALISVIVPVYKVENYLDRCVKSIIDQTYSNLEIILVDDGSPDKCPAMCDAWAEVDDRIRVIHKKNGGLSDARNKGIYAAIGEYIAFIDSDDWIAPEMIENLLTVMQRDKSQIAACTVEIVWEDSTPSELLTVQQNTVLDRLDAQRELLRERCLKQPVWYKLYKRETIEGILFKVGKQHEDVFWSYQVIGRAEKISITDYIGYYYFQHSGSIMGRGYSLKRLDALEAYEKRFAYISENFPELQKEAKIAIINACIYHGQMAMIYLPKEEQKQAFTLLNQIKKRYPIFLYDCYYLKTSHRLWILGSQISLGIICRIKNLLGVGL